MARTMSRLSLVALLVLALCAVRGENGASPDVDASDHDAEAPKKVDLKLDTAAYTKGESAVLDRLILENGYDTRIRPNNARGDPVNVTTSIYITTFGELDEMSMDFSIGLILRIRWKDQRLHHQGVNGNNRSFVLMGQGIDWESRMVWRPDIYFPDEKKAKFHEVTTPNSRVQIDASGDIHYTARMALTISCPMILTHFPMDRQKCQLAMESFSYNDNDLRLIWLEEEKSNLLLPVELKPGLELPQFELSDDMPRTTTTQRYSTGNYTRLTVTFNLARKFGFFLLQTYIPSVLIVVLSWLSFWIHPSAVPARITLGVTTVLTMTTQLTGSTGQTPKVSYPKAMDVWMAVCMIFVFAAIIEYAIVNVFVRTKGPAGGSASADSSPKKLNQHAEDHDKEEDEDENEDYSKLEGCCRRLTQFFSRPKRRNIPHKNVAKAIDQFSRLGFPLAFFVFNIFYWSIYASYSPPIN